MPARYHSLALALLLWGALHLVLENRHLHFRLSQVLVPLLLPVLLLLRRLQLLHRNHLNQHLPQLAAQLAALVQPFPEGLQLGIQLLATLRRTSTAFQAKLLRVTIPSPCSTISSVILPRVFRLWMLTVTSCVRMKTEWAVAYA